MKRSSRTKELLFSITRKDFTVETFPAGKAGGQHGNKTDTAVRIRHPASGAQGECREFKSQYQNKKTALNRLAETSEFKHYVWMRSAEESMTKDEKRKREESIARAVESAMEQDNLRIEIRDDRGKWTAWGVEPCE